MTVGSGVGSGVGVAAASVSGARPVLDGELSVPSGEHAAAERAMHSAKRQISSFFIMC